MNANMSPARAGPPYWRLLLLAFVLLVPGMAFAADSVGVSYKLEGCRNDGTIFLPNGDGNFICPDAAYTTGNLGKGWNELDLVPHRATITAGNSAPASQTFLFSLAADNCNAQVGSPFTCADSSTIGAPGYDDISVPVLNTDLSDASCAAPVSVSAMGVLSPGVGGTDVSIFRDVTITQSQNTVCVYDYYQRLALGSHLYNGSSLHSNLLNPSGNKDVPLPVKDVLPQALNKDMSALANASVTWDLTKEGSAANVSFGDVCAPDAPTNIPVSVTITWTKNAATPGDVSVTTHVYATNPASRTITVNVTDKIYKGLTQADLLDTKVSGDVDVPANSNLLIMTHTVSLDASAGSVGDFLNDVATGTYHDAVTDIPIPGTTTATANAQIAAGSVSDNTADISDSESITGTALTFSVPSPSVGSFLGGYVADTPTVGPVDWNALAQSSGGTITFAKTIYLANQTVTSGTLSDTAHLDTTSQHLSSPVSIGVTSSATVTLTVSKTIPDDYLNLAGDTLKVYFHIEGTAVSGYSNDISFTFENGGLTTLSTDLTNLTPDTYTVTEDVANAEYCDASDNCTNATLLVPFENPLVVDLLPQSGSMSGRCSGTAAFNNIAQEGSVRVEVQKITDPALLDTDPDYLWDFTLSGPTTCEPAIAGAGAGFVLFEDSLGGDCLLSDGDYTITETLKTGWKEDSATPNDGVDTLVCAFSVNVILDAGTTKSCTFHNTEYGHAKVIKTVLGAPPSGTDSFEFQLREGATLSSVGTILPGQDLFANAGNGGILNFTADLVPGNTYQLCEIVMPGWLTSLSPTFVPNGNDPLADNSVQCVDFTVNAGETKTFEVDNTPPPGGNARTIGFWRNWSACHRSRGHQEDVLGETLAAATPPGIQVGNFYLTTGQGCYAVNLLSKSQMTTGTKMPGDPLFNMTAQLVAAELNIAAGAGTCAAATSAISQANALLIKYGFNGDTYSPSLVKPKTAALKADANLANNLGGQLDMYNNNTLCP